MASTILPGCISVRSRSLHGGQLSRHRWIQGGCYRGYDNSRIEGSRAECGLRRAPKSGLFSVWLSALQREIYGDIPIIIGTLELIDPICSYFRTAEAELFSYITSLCVYVERGSRVKLSVFDTLYGRSANYGGTHVLCTYARGTKKIPHAQNFSCRPPKLCTLPPKNEQNKTKLRERRPRIVLEPKLEAQSNFVSAWA